MSGLTLIDTHPVYSSERRHVPLRLGAVTVGRKGQNDVQILHPKISSLHAVLHVAMDRVVVEDKSRNGVFINNQRVDANDPKTRLAFAGDKLRFGTTTASAGLEFQLKGDAVLSGAQKQARILKFEDLQQQPSYDEMLKTTILKLERTKLNGTNVKQIKNCMQKEYPDTSIKEKRVKAAIKRAVAAGHIIRHGKRPPRRRTSSGQRLGGAVMTQVMKVPKVIKNTVLKRRLSQSHRETEIDQSCFRGSRNQHSGATSVDSRVTWHPSCRMTEIGQACEDQSNQRDGMTKTASRLERHQSCPVSRASSLSGSSLSPAECPMPEDPPEPVLACPFEQPRASADGSSSPTTPPVKAKEPPSTSSLPDHLVCPLTLELFQDPVILASSGQTYEREMLLMALSRKPNVDPKSNAPFKGQSVIINNFSIRQAVDYYRAIPS